MKRVAVLAETKHEGAAEARRRGVPMLDVLTPRSVAIGAGRGARFDDFVVVGSPRFEVGRAAAIAPCFSSAPEAVLNRLVEFMGKGAR